MPQHAAASAALSSSRLRRDAADEDAVRIATSALIPVASYISECSSAAPRARLLDTLAHPDQTSFSLT